MPQHPASIDTSGRLCARVLMVSCKVIWRRYADVSPLTIGLYPFAADARISADYNLRTSEWSLMIKDVRPSDEGVYHCQVSTKDASEHTYNVQLNVNSEFRQSIRPVSRQKRRFM